MERDRFSLVFNTEYKKIFEYICVNPGSYFLDIVNNINIPSTSVHRKLTSMQDAGIVKKTIFKGKTIFYPRGLRSEEIEAAFSQLKHDDRKAIFLYVLDHGHCHQGKIVSRFDNKSSRQVRRHLQSLVDGQLLSLDRKKNRVFYSLGQIGRKIVIGSFESIDPFVKLLRDRFGEEVTIFMEERGDTNLVSIDLLNGDSIKIQLGRWKIMDIDEGMIYENKFIMLGDGGERVLTAIFNGCKTIDDVASMTALPDPVIRAKINTLRIMKLVVRSGERDRDLCITASGSKVVEKIFKMKR